MAQDTTPTALDKVAPGSGSVDAARAHAETTSGGPAGRTHQVLEAVATACLYVAGVQLVFLITTFGWLVFGRYVLNDTPTWVEQSALILVVWIVFLGGAVGVWRQTHLSVDFIRDSFPPRVRLCLHVLALVMMIALGAVMAWQGYELAAKTWARRIPMIGIAEGWRAVPVVLFGVLSVVFSIQHLIDLLTRGAIHKA